MKIILMIPMILSIVTASMFIATISNDDKVFAVCSEMKGENQRTIQCDSQVSNSVTRTTTNSETSTTTNPYTDTTTNPYTDTVTETTPTITEEVEEEEEEPSPQGCIAGLVCLGEGLLELD